MVLAVANIKNVCFREVWFLEHFCHWQVSNKVMIIIY